MSDKIQVIHVGVENDVPLVIGPGGFSIHADDTIMDIKRKIALSDPNDIGVDEIYLFGKIKKKEDPEKLFTLFTAKNLRPTPSIPYSDIEILEDNYDNEILKKYKKGKVYYKDFKSLFDWENIETYKTFGHKIFYKNDYPIVVNPYKLIENRDFDKNLFTHNENNQIIYDENNTLLFEQGNLCKNEKNEAVVYYVYAKEIFKNIKENNAIEPIPRIKDFYRYILQVYFPKLHYDKQIHTPEELYDINKWDNLESYKISYGNIDKFYTNKPEQTREGEISSINFTMHPPSKIHIPMDILFKIFHSNIKIPFIKYNPGRNRENIFRFYTNNYITDNNIKLPYLYVEDNKRYYKIQRIDHMLAPNNSLGFYIEFQDKLSPVLYCEFYPNGNINIRIDECSIGYDDLIMFLKESINEELINPINKFIKKSGFSYTLFEDFNTNVEIKYIKYKFKFELLKKNNFALNHWSRALKEIYVTNNKNFKTKNQIDFQYRKVGSYKVMNAIDKFILNYKRVEMEEDDNVLIDLLLDNFSKKIKTRGDAVELIENYNSETRFNLSVYSNKKIETTDNPGFKVLLIKKEKGCEIVYEDIDNYNYLKHIDVYTGFLIENLLLKGRKDRGKTLKEFELGKAIPPLKVAQNENVIEARLMEEQEQSVLDTGYEGGPGEVDEDENDKFQEDEADDYEDASESENEGEDDDDEIWGGGKEDDEDKKGYESSSSDDEVTGNLNNIELRGVNNYFINKIRQYQPEIVSKNSEGNTLSFAKSCQTNAGKTPVILTEKQKEDIDQADKNSGIKSYDEFLTTDTETKYHYICPRFWCFSDPESGAPDGRSLSLKQINEGACGGWDALIPKGSKTASNEKRIFEFTDAKSHEGIVGNDLVYKQHYPGYQQKKLKGKDGVKDICVPCCYNQASAKYKPEKWETTKKGNEIPEKEGTVYKSAPLNFKRNEKGFLPGSEEGAKEFPVVQKKPNGENVTYKGQDGNQHDFKKPGYDLEKYWKQRHMRENKPEQYNNTVRSRLNVKISKKRGVVKRICSPNDDNTYFEEGKLLEQLVRPIIESFPLKTGNLGYLQLALQKFFNYNSVKKDWTTSKNSKLKPGKWRLLRLGMSDDEYCLYNSFLSCIQNISYYYDELVNENDKDWGKNGQKFAISSKLTSGDEQFINKIQESFGFSGDYDNFEPSEELRYKFISLNKGNLYNMFSDSEGGGKEEKVKRAMVNFLRFLTESKTKKNAHEIFWDIVTAPKKNGGCYFEEGVNLIILKKPKDDIEDKIEVICPKNNFSKNIFDEKKKTILLYNEKDTYEPIYMYKRKAGTNWQVKKMFTLEDFRNNDFGGTGVWKTINALKENFENMCEPKTSMKHYDYNENKPLNKLLDFNEETKKYEITNDTATYSVIKQLYNTQYQVIAVLLDIGDNKKFALPCAPSAINLNIEKGEYEAELKDAILSRTDTENILGEFGLYEEDRLVVDNRCIVGLRTNTNQVVLIHPEGSNCEDLDRKDRMLMEYELDRKIMNNYPNQDEEREDIIKKIKLESNFYLMFRNLFKILINKKENETAKRMINDYLLKIGDDGPVFEGREENGKIVQYIRHDAMGYKKRLGGVMIRIRNMMEPHVTWVKTIDIDVDIDDILNCLDMDEAQCNGMKPICTFSDSCGLIFPETNLIYGDDAKLKNDEIYYKKLADELIRYKKIRDYVLKNDTFMNYDKVEYKINKDEIVIISNMFYKIYPNNIDSIDHSKYIKNHSFYDNTNIKDGDIKKYSMQLRMPEYDSDDDDDLYSEEEDVGVVEQKTAPPARKKATEKKKEAKKEEAVPPAKKAKPGYIQQGLAMYFIKEYIMKYHKNLKVGDFKKNDAIKAWTKQWLECVKYKKGFDSFASLLLWEGIFNKKQEISFPDDMKANWYKEDNILHKIDPYNDIDYAWTKEFADNLKAIPPKYRMKKTIWRYSTACLLRYICIDEKVGDEETMGDTVLKWFVKSGCAPSKPDAMKYLIK
jgi:hypothetical protein